MMDVTSSSFMTIIRSKICFKLLFSWIWFSLICVLRSLQTSTRQLSSQWKRLHLNLISQMVRKNVWSKHMIYRGIFIHWRMKSLLKRVLLIILGIIKCMRIKYLKKNSNNNLIKRWILVNPAPMLTPNQIFQHTFASRNVD